MRATAPSVGLGILTRAGVDLRRDASPWSYQGAVVHKVLDVQFRPDLRISTFDSIISSLPRVATSARMPTSLATSVRGVNLYDKAVSDVVTGSLPNLSTTVTATAASRRPVGVLEQARSTLALFDGATYGLQAKLQAELKLPSKVSALNFGLTKSNFLSAQIELAAAKLTRTGVAGWGELPTGAIFGLARLSSLTQKAGPSPSDLMSVARGVYGLTSFAARAAEMAVTDGPVEAEPDDTVEDWSDSTLAQDLRSALGNLHPALAAKLEGAWEVYRRRGPDALGQAATSLVELIDRSMDILAPAVEVLKFASDNHLTGPHYFTDRGSPTVALKVRFVLRARPLTAEAIDAQVAALTKARKTLQASKHSLDFSDDLLIGRLLLTVENVFTVILLSEG